MKRPWSGSRVIVAVAALALITSGNVAAQEPPRPTVRFTSMFPVSAAPAQYELVQAVLDFAPGAASREHSHGGPAFVTVLEGQITRREGNVETVYRAGQTFTEAQGVLHTASNKGTGRAQVFASYLLSPGSPQTLNHPDSPTPAVLPTTPFLSRTTLGTQPAQFNLIQVVNDLGPGAYQPVHTHGGTGVLMVIAGEVTFRAGGTAVTRGPGGTSLDGPPSPPGDVRNTGPGAAIVVAAFLVPPGVPLTTFITPADQPPAAVPAVRPPSTGDAGLLASKSDLLALAGLALLAFSGAGSLALAVRRR